MQTVQDGIRSQLSSLIEWNEAGTSFTIRNPDAFARDILPRYCKHNNFSSFQSENSVRDKPELLHNIKRKTATTSTSLSSVANGVTVNSIDHLDSRAAVTAGVTGQQALGCTCPFLVKRHHSLNGRFFWDPKCP